MKHIDKCDNKVPNGLISRRSFVAGAASAIAGFTIVPRYVLGGAGFKPPSEKLNIAAVGIGAMGKNNVDACKGGPAACSNFDYAGPLTEVVLLGNIALRTASRLEWDGQNMKITNIPEANPDLSGLRRNYRAGWTL